jgi:subtilisin family serine protease
MAVNVLVEDIRFQTGTTLTSEKFHFMVKFCFGMNKSPTDQLPASRHKCSGWCLWLLIVTVSWVVTWAASAQPGSQNSVGPVKGELLVKFRGGPRGAAATKAQQTFKHQVKRYFDHIGWQHIRLPRGITEAEALVRYRQNPDVLAVEPNYVFHLRLADTNTTLLPNDTRFHEQWALTRIGATNAWALSTGSSNVVVAVLDSGVRYNHEDLKANMWRNPNEIPGNGIDDDANGYVDDIYGIDAVSSDSDPIDDRISFIYHGTACSGIIGAVGNNGLGIAGLNWSVKVMALRLAATSNFIASAWMIECFEYVLTMKSRGVNIRVTNNSWGGDDSPSLAVRDAINAAGDAGILNVFAVGNSTTNLDVACDYPACFRLPSMINVAASDTADGLATFSNYGATNVDLAAPGVNIVVTDGITTNAYNPIFSGTSASAPFVAGAAALLASAYPSATMAEIKQALIESVDVLPAFVNKVQSGGRLNIDRAIQHPLLSSNAPPAVLSSPESQTVGLDYPATFRVIATGAAPMDYFWRFNGAPFAHTTEPVLTLPSVHVQNDGEYFVVLSNAFGMATSAVFTVSVVTEPTVLVQPEGLRVRDGTNITLVVVAAGAAPLAYQWQLNSQNIPGAIDACLVLTNVVSTMSGDYRVVLSNGYGTRTSAVARVTVLTRPHIVTQPQSQTVAVGANVSLSVTVTNTATLPLGGLWARDNRPAGALVFDEQFTAVTNFQNIQTNVAGRWSLIVSNEGPNGVSTVLSSNANLTVVAPPTNRSVLAGSDVTFATLAFGPPPIRYQWQHAGTNLPNAMTPILSLTNVQVPDAGSYAIVITNAIGQATAFTASLQVLSVPQPSLTEPNRLPDGTFEMTLRGLSNQQPYAVEISSNLIHWTTLTLFTATNSSMPLVDATASQAAQRFYRARSNP